MKVVKIEGYFEIPKNVTLEDFNDAFISWVESQGCFFGGGLVEESEVTDSDTVSESKD